MDIECCRQCNCFIDNAGDFFCDVWKFPISEIEGCSATENIEDNGKVEDGPHCFYPAAPTRVGRRGGGQNKTRG